VHLQQAGQPKLLELTSSTQNLWHTSNSYSTVAFIKLYRRTDRHMGGPRDRQIERQTDGKKEEGSMEGRNWYFMETQVFI
jgi:hypothetical protein